MDAIHTNEVNSLIQFWAGKISSSKALIAVTSYTNDKINNAANIYFNQQNDQLINGFGIYGQTTLLDKPNHQVWRMLRL